MVRDETRRREATSRMVIKSGRSASDTFGSALVLYDMERIIVFHLEVVKTSYERHSAIINDKFQMTNIKSITKFQLQI